MLFCSFIYVFRFVQVIVNALLTSTLFFRTTRHPNSINEANFYLGALFFSLTSMLVSPAARTSSLLNGAVLSSSSRGAMALWTQGRAGWVCLAAP